MKDTLQTIRTLFAVQENQTISQSNERIDVLTDLVFMLLAEVEALRSTMKAVDSEKYKTIYQDTMILNHNSAGMTPGVGKILERFIGKGRSIHSDEGPLLGVELLERLGCSGDEIKKYINRIQEVREYT
jgi:hypothetical protein